MRGLVVAGELDALIAKPAKRIERADAELDVMCAWIPAMLEVRIAWMFGRDAQLLFTRQIEIVDGQADTTQTVLRQLFEKVPHERGLACTLRRLNADEDRA